MHIIFSGYKPCYPACIDTLLITTHGPEIDSIHKDGAVNVVYVLYNLILNSYCKCIISIYKL